MWSSPSPSQRPSLIYIKPVVGESAAVRYQRERVDAWIRNRLIAYPLASCLLCRKPIIAGEDWQEASNGEVRGRFYRACHAEWPAEREAAARQALGLEGCAVPFRSDRSRPMCGTDAARIARSQAVAE